MRHILPSLVASTAITGSAFAAIPVTITGPATINTSSPLATFTVTTDSSSISPAVTGFQLRAQLSDGPDGNDDPIFTSYTFGGGMWGSGSNYTNTGGGITSGYWILDDVTLNAGQTAVGGLIATMDIDVTGVAPGTYSLLLSIPAGPVSSNFLDAEAVPQPVEITVTGGTFQVVVPEPATIGLLGAAGLGLLSRRRRA